MPAKVRIPAPLRKLTNDQVIVEVEGKTIQDLLSALDKKHPGLKDRICDESGQVRRFVNIFVNGEDIRFKDGAKTPVTEGAEVSIIPAIAGGCR
jgi:MoaD family protein